MKHKKKTQCFIVYNTGQQEIQKQEVTSQSVLWCLPTEPLSISWRDSLKSDLSIHDFPWVSSCLLSHLFTTIRIKSFRRVTSVRLISRWNVWYPRLVIFSCSYFVHLLPTSLHLSELSHNYTMFKVPSGIRKKKYFFCYNFFLSFSSRPSYRSQWFFVRHRERRKKKSCNERNIFLVYLKMVWKLCSCEKVCEILDFHRSSLILVRTIDNKTTVTLLGVFSTMRYKEGSSRQKNTNKLRYSRHCNVVC